jgi:hypothetical protein
LQEFSQLRKSYKKEGMPSSLAFDGANPRRVKIK